MMMAMDSSQDGACSVREYELSLKTAQLETAYEKSLAQLGSLVAQEETRISRVDCTILETDHEVLQMRYERSEYDIEQLLQAEKALKQQLLQAQEDLANLQLSTRTDSRVMQDLKNEVISMKHKVSDFEKCSADKISLTKEMSHMKQEFERLKNQNKSYQTVVAEKSSLERQLNSLEVQLEEERRALERNKTAENKNPNGEVAQQLKKLQEELKREVDERRRAEEEMHEKSTSWEEQKKVLEERLEKLRKQLRTTKDKLKEQQNSSRISHGPQQIDRSRQSAASDRSTSIGHTSATFDPGMTIATPGAVKINNKTQRPSAALGEKSVFSITPFLRRNVKSTGSPDSSDDDLDAQDEPEPVKKRPKVSFTSDKVERSSKNQQSSKKDQSTVNNEDDDDGEAHEPEETVVTDKSIMEESVLSRKSEEMPSMLGGMSNNGSSLDGKQNRRKRKVLGGQRDVNLFDEEDEELEGARRIERSKLSLKPGPKRPQALGVARLGFRETSTFSPLKRDKRLI